MLTFLFYTFYNIGIWDCMSSQEVITFVRKQVAEQIPLETICEMTMDHCLASDSGMTGVGCDNMTMVIVAILNGKTLEEWYEHITTRVAVRLGPADSKVRRANGDEDPETFKEQNPESSESASSTASKEAMEDSKEEQEKEKVEKEDKEEDTA